MSRSGTLLEGGDGADRRITLRFGIVTHCHAVLVSLDRNNEYRSTTPVAIF